MRAPDGLTLHTAAERPDLDARADELGDRVWPEYNMPGDVLNAHWPRLDERFPELQFVLVDAAEEIVAQGHMVPCRWDGTADGLPEGIDEAIAGAFANAEPADAACALAAEIQPAHQGRGLAPEMIRAMTAICRRHGLGALVAPVRPSLKARYALTPIERYAARTGSRRSRSTASATSGATGSPTSGWPTRPATRPRRCSPRPAARRARRARCAARGAGPRARRGPPSRAPGRP